MTHLQSAYVTVPYIGNPCWALVWHHGRAGVDQLSSFLTMCLSHQLVSTKMLLDYRKLEWRLDTKFSWKQYLEKEEIYFNLFKRRFISICQIKKHSPRTSSAGCVHLVKTDFTKWTTHKTFTGCEPYGLRYCITWYTVQDASTREPRADSNLLMT